MLAFGLKKKKKDTKISIFCIRIQFLKSLHCCLGFYLHNPPKWHSFKKPLYKHNKHKHIYYLLKMPRILVRDPLALLRVGFCIGTEEWFSTSCHIPNTSGLLAVQELTPPQVEREQRTLQPHGCSLFSDHTTTAPEQSYSLENAAAILLPASIGRLVAKLLKIAVNRSLNSNTYGTSNSELFFILF